MLPRTSRRKSKGRESSLHAVRVHVSLFVYVASFAGDYSCTVVPMRFGLIYVQISSKFGSVDFSAFLDYMFSFDGGCRRRLVEGCLRGCLPLFPGDLLLTTGYFHCHLLHSTLPFSELKDTAKILAKFPGVSADTIREFEKMAAVSNSERTTAPPNRTVATFRQIECHYAKCKTKRATQNKACDADQSSEKGASGVVKLVVTANELLEQLRATIKELQAESDKVSAEDKDGC